MREFSVGDRVLVATESVYSARKAGTITGFGPIPRTLVVRFDGDGTENCWFEASLEPEEES